MNEIRAIVEACDAATMSGERCAIATIVSVAGSSYRRPGARMLIRENGQSTGTISAGCLEADVIEHARRVMRGGEAKLIEYNTASVTDEMAWGLGLGCNGIVRVLVEPVTAASPHIDALRRSHDAPVALLLHDASGAEVFSETLQPPVPLIVFGAGADALPVVELAQKLGWRTEVVDPNARMATRERFASADVVTLARPEDVAARVAVTSRTMALLMTHNYAHDLALLEFLLASPAQYIGVMGPRHRTERLLRDLGRPESTLDRLHSPVGLDLGATGPTDIALSIVAEIRAVLAGRNGGMLRERNGAIEARRFGGLRARRSTSSRVNTGRV